MRLVPRIVLLLLLLAMCGLCAVQWWRESQLRDIAVAQRNDLAKISTERDELDTRLKASDAEILRLTTALTDLRNNSVSKQTHEEVATANKQLRETIEKQNSAIKEQNEALMKQNAAVQQANATIGTLTAERDAVARRLNEVTGLYNKLVKPGN